MAVVRYDPWNLLNEMQQDINRLFAGRRGEGEDDSRIVTSTWVPAMDIKEEADRFVVYADLPGIDPKDIDITMANGVLTVSGERRLEKEEERQGYRRIERARGSFYRRFALPDTADAERIQANSRNGVLEISIAKQEKAHPRRIEVQS